MKNLGLILLSATAVYSAPFEESAELLTIPLEKGTNLEIAAFEPTLQQQPFTSDQFAFPEPVMKLPAKKSPFLAASLSTIPGLGHVYLGDYKTAGGLFGSTYLAMGAAGIPGTTQAFKVSTLVTAMNTSSYGIYAAYRDARNMNGQSNYKYKMPTDSLEDLITAPFRFSVLKKPEVWGGLLGAFALVVAVGHLAPHSDATIQLSLSSDLVIHPLAAFPVGIGEEAVYRGYLQSAFCEYMSPTASIALTSLAFGAAHIPNAQNFSHEDQMRYYTISLPVITTLGAYFGWMTHKNRSLKESVALHAWYDFILFSAQYAASSASIGTPPAVFSYSTSF